jgi:hypothetical protein
MKIAKIILLIGFVVFLPKQSFAQSASCTGALVNGTCYANVTPLACANELFSQSNGTETCSVNVGGTYAIATFSNVNHSVSVTTSPSCSGVLVNGVCRQEIGNADNSCLPGTTTQGPNGSQTCQAIVNGQPSTINVCTGAETSGPCRAERINMQTAIAAAQQRSLLSGQQCRAQANFFPGIDPNTGLSDSLFYFTICEGEFGFNDADYSRGTGSVGTQGGGVRQTATSTGQQGGSSGRSNSFSRTIQSADAYVVGILNLTAQFIENAKRLYGN